MCEIAQERGLPQTREYLQELGAKLVAEDPLLLCARVMQSVTQSDNNGIVIDGLRHEVIYNTLKQLSSPRQLLCVYVDVAEKIRLARLIERDKLTATVVSEQDRHSTEIQVRSVLRKLANYIADNNGDLNSTIILTVSWIKSVQT